jgi:hypothetical protein
MEYEVNAEYTGGAVLEWVRASGKNYINIWFGGTFFLGMALEIMKIDNMAMEISLLERRKNSKCMFLRIADLGLLVPCFLSLGLKETIGNSELILMVEGREEYNKSIKEDVL